MSKSPKPPIGHVACTTPVAAFLWASSNQPEQCTLERRKPDCEYGDQAPLKNRTSPEAVQTCRKDKRRGLREAEFGQNHFSLQRSQKLQEKRRMALKPLPVLEGKPNRLWVCLKKGVPQNRGCFPSGVHLNHPQKKG